MQCPAGTTDPTHNALGLLFFSILAVLLAMVASYKFWRASYYKLRNAYYLWKYNDSYENVYHSFKQRKSRKVSTIFSGLLPQYIAKVPSAAAESITLTKQKISQKIRQTKHQLNKPDSKTDQLTETISMSDDDKEIEDAMIELSNASSQLPVTDDQLIKQESSDNDLSRKLTFETKARVKKKLNYTMNISFKNLSLTLKSNGKVVVDNVSGVLNAGTVTAIMGPSGIYSI